MRGKLLIITFALLMTVPAVAADDPGYSVPTTDGLESAAADAVAEQTDATTAFTRETFGNASGAVNQVQTLSFPAGHTSDAVSRAGGYGGSTIGVAAELGKAGLTWSVNAALVKTDETEAVASAGDEIGASAVNAGAAITSAGLGVVCTPSLDSTTCSEDSVVGTAQSEANRFLGQGSDDLGSEQFDATRQAVHDLFFGLVPMPQ